MIRDFGQTVVLTSQNPEAFINFRYSPGDSSILLSIYPDASLPDSTLFINGLDANVYLGPDPSEGNFDLWLSDPDPSIVSFHLYTRELQDFDYNLNIDASWASGNLEYDVSILNRPYIINAAEINVYETSEVQVEGETPYLVLRTNPKFTGNIKLTIDPSNNLYLDTFKISNILNNKKYRKQKVSSESVLSSDVKRIFSDMPLGELYRLDAEDTLDIAAPKTDLFRQYNLNYSYGARLFEDELYDDDYAIMAPLWINSRIPDYFAIFRINSIYNSETYESVVNLTDLANDYLEEGELIASWGIKETTPLGTYLRNHLDELLTVRSPLFLSLSDPTQKDPDPNTWYGIAVDKGIIAGRSETPYFFDQKDTFTDTNAFVSEGFERLNLLCPNLINMEYVFSDHDVSLYTMHRYFGLYLTENELYEISYYAEEPDASIQVLSLDGKDPSIFFNSSIFDSSGNVVSGYQNRIFTLNDIQTIKRITNAYQVNGENKEYIESWLNKPGDHLFSTEVEEKTSNKFVTISIENKLTQGEHLRIVDKTQFKIWEIVGLNSDFIEAGNPWTYIGTYQDPSGNYPTVYRGGFSTKGSKSDQIEAIKGAFDVFQNFIDIPFETTIIKEEEAQLSFRIKDFANSNDFWFQRLTAQITDHIYDPSTGIYDPSSHFNTVANYEDITFYGVLEPSIGDFERLKYDSSYGPINFEIFGDRMSIMTNFMETSSSHLYSFDSSMGKLFQEYTMYMATDNWYRLVSPFDISTATNHSYNYMIDPHESKDKFIIKTPYQLFTVKGKWNAYSTYPLIISLMGINPVKDIDFTVYDSSLGFQSEYWYAREEDSSTYYFVIEEDSHLYIENRNAYEIIGGDGSIHINGSKEYYSGSLSVPFYFNTFEGSAYIRNNGATTITYNQINGSKNYFSYDPSISEENINDYYLNSGKLKYGLTVPYVAKWVGLGSDCRNNPFRLLLDVSLFNDASTNFIPFENNFAGEISYPSFKYLDPGERAWEDYIFFDINDVIEYSDDGSTNYTTFKDLMFDGIDKDVFSKLVYSNHNINSTKLRSSIVYYNNYKETIDTIINGISFSFGLEQNAKNTLNVQDWDRYRISFMSTTSRNRDNNNIIEVIINENTETILIIWYQGVDVLNYNKRFSSYFGGRGVLDPSTGNLREFQSFKTGDNYWSFIKSPFIVNNSSLSSNFVNIYGTSATYDPSICSPYAQLNWNLGDLIYSIFNAYDGNNPISYNFNFTKQYDTFRQYVNYNYIKYTATYGNNVINYGYSYMENSNIYRDNVCELDSLENIFTLNSNIGYYIFRGNTTYTNNNFSVPPIIITINDPRSYKGLYTYNGWYRPKFNNILNFNYNESIDIINTVEKDFTFSNTNLKEYNNISQYWYNKVVEEVTLEDVSTKNAIGYQESFNVFKSQWDADYYILDTSTSQTLIDGYNSTLELPSYFGSKLIKLPETLELDSWDLTTASSTEGRSKYELQFNLTRKIVNMFKATSTFTDNWGALTTSDKVIDGYIKKTILGYYNISKPKIDVKIWTKPYDGRRIAYILDSSTFIQDLAANIDGNLYYINNEYFYRMKVRVLPNFTYFVKFTLFER